MASIFIIGIAYTGESQSVLSNSASGVTFHEYIESLTPWDLNIRQNEYVYYEIDKNTLGNIGAIITAQAKITLTNGNTKSFLYWRVGNPGDFTKWLYQALPIGQATAPLCVAVYGIPYKKGSFGKVDPESMKKSLHGWDKD
jgi:hypothetical protein